MHEQTIARGGARVGLVGSWTLVTMLGETLAQALIALTGGLVSAAFGSATTQPPDLVLRGLIVLVGALEGLSVGALQAVVIRRVLPGVRAATFIAASVAGFAAAWAAGVAGSALEPAGMPGHAALLAIAAASGVALGVIVGTAQWLALRPHVRGAGLWPVANALGWGAGLLVAGLGAVFFPSTTESATAIALGMASGAASGVIVGLVTAPFLVWLAGRPAWNRDSA